MQKIIPLTFTVLSCLATASFAQQATPENEPAPLKEQWQQQRQELKDKLATDKAKIAEKKQEYTNGPSAKERFDEKRTELKQKMEADKQRLEAKKQQQAQQPSIKEKLAEKRQATKEKVEADKKLIEQHKAQDKQAVEKALEEKKQALENTTLQHP